MCNCGRTGNKSNGQRAMPLKSALLGAAGLVMLEYQGDEAAAIWYGNVTGTRYPFGRAFRRRWVDREDATRLLDMTLDGDPAFVEVEQ